METQSCLYDILGVEATSSNEEIRSAYRKLALKWHPDKIQQSGASPEECQEATIHFQEIGRAYEVLADPSERSWYDSHRSQILSSSPSSPSSPSDFHFNPWPFFSPSIFAGYGDTGKGFYAVYGELFSKLHQQEVSFANARGISTPLYPPDMGNLATSYPQVQRFYNHWLGFTTVKDFAWCDEYKASMGPNRKLRRLMEEENKKIRSKERKEFNEAIRRLAAFVRKRDKRVLERQIEVQRLEKEKEEMRKARHKKEDEEKLMKARLYKEAEWTKIELDQDADDGSDYDESVGSYDWGQSHSKSNGAKKERQDEFFCIVCNKKFKSDEQWKNHEKSKKHLEKVAILKESFEEDDEEFEVISHGSMEGHNSKLESESSAFEEDDEEFEVISHGSMQGLNLDSEMKSFAGRSSIGKESPSTFATELSSIDRQEKEEVTTSAGSIVGDSQAEWASVESLKCNTGEGSVLSSEIESDEICPKEADGEEDDLDSLLTMVNSFASRQRQSTSEDDHDAIEQSALRRDPSQEEGDVREPEEKEMSDARLKSYQVQGACESTEDLEDLLTNGQTSLIEGDTNGKLEGEIGGPLKRKKSKRRLRNEKQQAASLNRHSKIAEELLNEKRLSVIMQELGINAKKSNGSVQELWADTLMSGKDTVCFNKVQKQKLEKEHSQDIWSSKGKNTNAHSMIDIEQPRRPARGKKSKAFL